MYYYDPKVDNSAFDQVFEDLAKSLEKEKDMVFGKFNAKANDSKELKSKKIKDFPALIFFPKSDKSGIEYTGEKTVLKMSNWLKETKKQAKIQ